MIRKFLRITALVLTLCLLLTGCSLLDTLWDLASLYGLVTTSFQDMVYTRPVLSDM